RFFFSSSRRHTRSDRDWSSDVCSSALGDMEMDLPPGKYYGDALKQAVQEGKVPQARLDNMVTRILRPMFRLGIFEHPAASQPEEIGRASCRERVEISVGGGSLDKV